MQYTVVFDTGSANLWVLSKQGTHVPSGKGLYIHDRSSTYVPNGKTMNIKYGSGFVQGFYSNDIVHVGGLTVPSMELGEALLALDNEHGTLFSGMQGEGILGLAFQGISEHANPVFVDLLYQNKQITSRVFSFYLTRNVRRKGSMLILGGYNRSYATEDFKFVPLIDDSFWAVGLSQLDVRSGDDTLRLCEGAECVAIVDTGTSFIGVPMKKLPVMMEFITRGKRCVAQKSKLTVCDCDRNMTGFPDITIDLYAGVDANGARTYVTLTLKPEDYLLHFFAEFRYKCAVGLQSVHSNLLGKDDDVYILGTTVLKTYYTLFDADNLRVGFAYTADVKEPLTLAGPVCAALYKVTSLMLYIVILVCVVRIFQTSHSQAQKSGPSGWLGSLMRRSSYGAAAKASGGSPGGTGSPPARPLKRFYGEEELAEEAAVELARPSADSHGHGWRAPSEAEDAVTTGAMSPSMHMSPARSRKKPGAKEH
jgi:hypothetical protein